MRVLSWNLLDRSNGEGRRAEVEGRVMDARELPEVRTGWGVMVDERGEEVVRYIGGHPSCLVRIFL